MGMLHVRYNNCMSLKLHNGGMRLCNLCLSPWAFKADGSSVRREQCILFPTIRWPMFSSTSVYQRRSALYLVRCAIELIVLNIGSELTAGPLSDSTHTTAYITRILYIAANRRQFLKLGRDALSLTLLLGDRQLHDQGGDMQYCRFQA